MAHTDVRSSSSRRLTERRIGRSRLQQPIAAMIALMLAILAVLAPASATPSQAASNAVNIVNAYRAMAGLGPVTEDAVLSDGDAKHSKWMILNQTLSLQDSHTEVVGSTAYTPEGAKAGKNGNTFMMFPAASFTDQSAMDFWMSGAFHQLHMIDPKLQQVGYGSFTQATATANDMEAAATLDVQSAAQAGLVGPAATAPIMFPGNGKVTTLREYKGHEFPDPFSTTSCAGYTAEWNAPAGPAITLQLVNTTPAVTAHSITRNGTPIEHCWFDETTYTNPDANVQALGRLVMANSIDGTARRHAISLMPRQPLADGTYNVSITSNGQTYAWTFFVGAAPTQRTLSVSKNGTGTGTVTGTGISCGADCTETYADGTNVTLTASPAAGSVFAGWTGDCTGTATTCTLTMNANKTATATFNTTPPPPPTQRTLTVAKNGTGTGTVSSNPAGISCGADCTENYNDGTPVTLTASPAAGSVFAGWTGDCTGTAATCSLTMSANKSATATFNTAPVTQRTLTVTRAGTGVGSVVSNVAGIICGADCSEAYTDGAVVVLTASTSTGSVFAGWAGDCTGTATTCSLTMSANRSVTATFNTAPTPPPPPTGSFVGTATVTQATVTPGGTVGITATVTTPPAGTYVVDIEVHDATDNQVFQWYWEGQQFTAGQTRQFSTTWQVPANMPPGTYKVQVGIFSGANWATQHLYNDNAAQLTIGAAPAAQRTLIVSKSGTGSGTVTGTGIACGADCSESYADGTNVTLTASPAAGSTFAGWSGACTGTNATCTVAMNANKTATAAFTAAAPAPVGNFAATATASQATVSPGGSVGITAQATVPTTGTYVVDIEVHNLADNRVFQWYWEGQQFTAGQTRQLSTTWQVPANMQTGAYRVQVGIFSGNDWATEHLYNNDAARVTVATACSPRPQIQLTTAKGPQPNQLQVTLTAGAGNLQQLSFGAASNARITVPAGANGRPGLTNSAGNTSLTLTDQPHTLTFTVTRVTPGQGATVPLTVTDGCGSWSTFVGGGPAAF